MAQNVDNKLIPLAKRYSDALVEIANEKNEIDAVAENLDNVVEIIDYSKELQDFLNHPVIPASEKKDLIKNIFEGKITEDTLNLLNVLIDKNKISLLPTINHCFEESVDDARNVLKVGVVSAVEMDEDSKAKLKTKLESKLNKTVKFDFEINPEIIAGLILKIQDKTIDGSMANKLGNFKKALGN